jgi:hypothetical protein
MLSLSVTRVEMLEHTKKSCVLNLSAAAGLSLNNARKRHLDSFSCECGRPEQNKRPLRVRCSAIRLAHARLHSLLPGR